MSGISAERRGAEKVALQSKMASGNSSIGTTQKHDILYTGECCAVADAPWKFECVKPKLAQIVGRTEETYAQARNWEAGFGCTVSEMPLVMKL